MKSWMIFPVVLGSVFCIETGPENFSQEVTSDIFLSVAKLQPANTIQDSLEIATAIERAAKQNDLDWKTFLTILAQESSLRRDPQRCLNRSHLCRDYGIGQINWETWGHTLKLNKQRLLVDLPYAIEASAKILSFYKVQYSARESTWYSRYNSATPRHRKAYIKRLTLIRGKIDINLRGFTDVRFRKFSGENSSLHYRPASKLYARNAADVIYLYERSSREVRRTIQSTH